MNKNINIVALLLLVHVVACWPLLLRWQSELASWFADERICMIFDWVMAVTAISILLSLLAAVFRAYKTAFVIMIVPFFIQAVVACSAALVAIFHRELTAAMAMGKLRAVGTKILDLVRTPYRWFGDVIGANQ